MSFATVLLASFVTVLAAVAAMAIGVLFGRRAISGSCGGIAGRCAGCAGTGACPRKRANAPTCED